MTATRNVKGLLGTKLGMTQVWDENNNLIPVTVVQADSQRRHPAAQRRTSMATSQFRSATARSIPARSPSRWLVTSRRQA